MNLIGQYESKIRNDRVHLPSSLKKQLSQKYMDSIICPIDGSISLNFELQDDFINRISDVRWSPRISKILANHRIYPSSAMFCDTNIETNVDFIESALDNKLYQRALLQIKGNEFEKLIYEILKDLGFEVELNFRVKGAEIDLFICSKSSSGIKEYIIIECKQHGISQKKVSISVVHRLFGLQEILRMNNTNIKKSIVLSTTGFTQNAKLAVTTDELDIDLLNFQEFIEWLDFYLPKTNKLFIPFFDKKRINIDSGINLHKDYLNYLNESEIIIFPYANRIEIWGRTEYNRMMTGIPQDYSDLAEKVLGKISI